MGANLLTLFERTLCWSLLAFSFEKAPTASMAITCSIPGCDAQADFCVHLFDITERYGTSYDRDDPTSAMCEWHVVRNEVNTQPQRRRGDPYWFSKIWEPEGWVVYSLLPKASSRAKKLFPFLPHKPTEPDERPIVNVLRNAFMRGELKTRLPCSFDECPFPAVFMVQKLQPGKEGWGPQEVGHGLGNICGDHAHDVAKVYRPTGKDLIFLRPIHIGRMNLPSDLAEFVHFNDGLPRAAMDPVHTVSQRHK